MAITRAQIPEQIDVFQEGGGATSNFTQQEIIDLYSALGASAPVTQTDIENQMENMAGLFPQQRKANIYDLASAVGAGMVAGASDPGGFGVGLTAGLESFNRKVSDLKAQKNKLKQDLAMLAYQQVETKRQEQAALRTKALDREFDLMVQQMKNKGELFGGTSTEAGAWNYILSKIDPSTNTFRMVPDGEGGMKPYDPAQDPYFRVAKATLEQAKTELRNEPGVGPRQITTPGFDVDAVISVQKPVPPEEAIDELRKDSSLYDQFVSYYGEDQVPVDLRRE